METLFLHEAVPGHHMQVARAAEIEGLHPWRSQANFNIVYAEGWALYAEGLGYDLGFYKDPYQRYGNLQAQLFRAARLVVDTGIHAYNWPRDKAIAYMANQGGARQGLRGERGGPLLLESCASARLSDRLPQDPRPPHAGGESRSAHAST